MVKGLIIACIGDTPAQSKIGGFQGHNAKSCCRFCQIQGVKISENSHYYYPNTSQSNVIIPVRNRNESDMLLACRAGIEPAIESGLNCKPAIISLKSLSWTSSFPLGTIHLLFNNIPILMTQLYMGKFDLQEPFEIPEKFPTIGALIEQIQIPSYFTQSPINIYTSLRLYKCKDWKYWICNYSSGILKRYLPNVYWKHWDLFVDIANIFLRHSLTTADLCQIQWFCKQFVTEFVRLFFRHYPNQIKLCRYSVHAMLHLSQCLEVVGPCFTFWEFPMERICGEILHQTKSSVLPYGTLIKTIIAKSVIDTIWWSIEDEEPSKVEKGALCCAHGLSWVLGKVRKAVINPWTMSST